MPGARATAVAVMLFVWALGLALTAGFWGLAVYALYLVVKHFS